MPQRIARLRKWPIPESSRPQSGGGVCQEHLLTADLEGWAWRLGPEGREKEGGQRDGRWQKPLTREEEAEWTKEEAVHKASGSAPAHLKEQEGFLG